MTNIVVEPATWRDAEAIYKLRLKLEADTQVQTGIPSDTAPDIDAQYFYETLGWFFDSGKVVFVARADNKVVGYVGAMSATYVGKAKGVSIIGFYVEEEYRNASVARLLLKFVAAAVAGANTKRIQAVVMVNNRQMLKSIVRMKFKPVAIIFDREVSNGVIFRK